MYRKHTNPTDRPVRSSIHESRTESVHFDVRAISEIPELSHSIQDRRPRHSKHPSPLAMPAVFPLLFNTKVGRFPELTPVRSQATSHGFLPWMPVTGHVPSVSNVSPTLRLTGHPAVDVDIHSSGRVMSPASRVASHNAMTWLRTGVSSGNWPMFVTKSRKYHAHLEDPVGTEYLEDVALERRGKVRGSWRSLGR